VRAKRATSAWGVIGSRLGPTCPVSESQAQVSLVLCMQPGRDWLIGIVHAGSQEILFGWQ
jgi:hypothetical protein